jgi:Ca2+-binding RTX toxin-like protein
MVLVAVPVVFAAAQDWTAAAPRANALTTGAFSVSDSRAGQAIFTATNLAPGGTTTGTVTIKNTGDAAGSLTLAPISLTDTPGPGGGALSGAIDLRVVEIGTEDTEIWVGKLGAMPRLTLATLAPGAARTYRFTVTLPDNGVAVDSAGDNAFQTAAVDVGYEWTLTATDDPPITTPDPVPPVPTTPPAPPAPITPPTDTTPMDTRPIQPPDVACAHTIHGNSSANWLTGTPGGDTIWGGGGADLIYGLGGNDCILGQGGADRIHGGAGIDHIDGGPGADLIYGDAGNDRLVGGPGRDQISGGAGNDLVLARDGERDFVDCGAGWDRVIVDRFDVVKNCEVVTRR